MKIDKIIKKLSQTIPPKENIGRPSLEGVLFDKNYAVATDTYKMVKVIYNKQQPLEKQKYISKKHIENNIDINELPEYPKLFPKDYESFFKKEGGYNAVKFNPQYIIDIMEVYKSAGIDEVYMEINKNNPIFFSGGDFPNGIEIRAILMPIFDKYNK